jgi:hypothetical protein
MVRRALIPLIAGAVLMLPIALFGAFRAAPAPTVAVEYGEPERGNGPRPGDEEVLVEWVIRFRDLVACETATPELRRTQHQYRGRIRMVAYAVDADTSLVRSFLRRERLSSVELVRITEGEFRRDFAQRLGPSGRTPTLLVMAHGRSVGAYDAAVRTDAGRRGVSDFGARLAALLAPATARGE